MEKYKTQDQCPDAKKHTKCPPGFIDWFGWAEKKEKTHKQIKCPTCGFFAIWIKK